jgi:PIN domain nuclease of toxin-antitoxin system
MRLLLDTHTLLWAMTKSRTLPQSAHRLIEDERNDLFFSAISVFEIASKRASGRRSAPTIGADIVAELALRAGLREVPVTHEHAAAVETLAITHPDAFDRVLLAQAQIEGLQLLTHDEDLAGYDSRTILF